MASTVEVPTSGSSDKWFNVRQRLETQEVNPQTSSPFYNGRIPPEIRNLIFKFAVAEFPSPEAPTLKPDVWVQQSHDLAPTDHIQEAVPQGRGIGMSSRTQKPYFDWLRFDNTEPMRVDAALLLTCRRVYLETYSLPLLQAEQRFYCHRGPRRDDSVASRTDIHQFIASWLSKPAPVPVPDLKQKDLVRSVRLFLQQNWLEDTLPQFVITNAWFTNLEHLRITLRRSDWWDWEQNATLRINPFKGNCCHVHTIDLMRRDMSTETGNVDFAPGAWGSAFSHMSKLKTLTIDFETSEDKHDEMEIIVDWALKWRFPLPDSRHLCAHQPASKMSWRGFAYHWSDLCVSCGNRALPVRRRPGSECLKCIERFRLVSHDYGPQLLIWTVLWKPVQDI
ncbi:hypothetical protein HD806DRAFT_496618 [Xylariaceae sp. AK1471]|nr:hypothetical protein HD806DRAFT_496618 [Xylariaceae sp. AK1471]